jgi:hypothetical protein
VLWRATTIRQFVALCGQEQRRRINRTLGTRNQVALKQLGVHTAGFQRC